MKKPTHLPLAAGLALLLTGPLQAQTLQPWMSTEIQEAWNLGYKGQKVNIKVIDDFNSATKFSGNLGTGTLTQRHGEWTRLEASLLAPQSTISSIDWNTTSSVALAKGLNVLNVSYGMYNVANIIPNWDSQEKSIISYAKNGSAVISKAAGNDGVAIGSLNSVGKMDYLIRDLTGTPTTIFVGALTKNGSTSAPASLASYSNYAGSNTAVQGKFLVVGVDSTNMGGLAGTSFAAPIVTGYAAVLGSKFTSATPTQIVNQLLNTARTDTISGYNPAIHGKGEASISRAIAPLAIK